MTRLHVPEHGELLIYGASDDLLEIEGPVTEEFPVSGQTVLEISEPTGARLHVAAEYAPATLPGTEWALSIVHVDPGWRWPVSLTSRPDQSEDPAIRVLVPEGSTITCADE